MCVHQCVCVCVRADDFGVKLEARVRLALSGGRQRSPGIMLWLCVMEHFHWAGLSSRHLYACRTALGFLKWASAQNKTKRGSVQAARSPPALAATNILFSPPLSVPPPHSTMSCSICQGADLGDPQLLWSDTRNDRPQKCRKRGVLILSGNLCLCVRNKRWMMLENKKQRLGFKETKKCRLQSSSVQVQCHVQMCLIWQCYYRII